jgi:hypothetical protein
MEDPVQHSFKKKKDFYKKDIVKKRKITRNPRKSVQERKCNHCKVLGPTNSGKCKQKLMILTLLEQC